MVIIVKKSFSYNILHMDDQTCQFIIGLKNRSKDWLNQTNENVNPSHLFKHFHLII